MGVMPLTASIGALTAGLEVLVKPAMVEQTRNALQEVLDVLEADSFRHNAPIANMSFGNVSSGTMLAHHHSLAQQIVADTLDGMNEDIAAFVTNVVRAAQILTDLDDTAAEDMKKREAVLEQFNYLSTHSHADQNNQQTRDDLEGDR
jgi:enamine deaminase RidA (YjgF/YER057c/UK114 family)